jgi:hypothetical protein
VWPLQVVIFNTADAYEPTVDHVGNSPDAAAAVCHCVATMLHRLGPRAAKEYFDSDGVAVTVRILQKHRTVLSVVANGCHALAAALACLGPEVADECVNENAPFLMLQLVKELFVEPVAVYWATAVLGQMTRHDALRVALAQTKGALSLLVRASEAYRAHPRCGGWSAIPRALLTPCPLATTTSRQVVTSFLSSPSVQCRPALA